MFLLAISRHFILFQHQIIWWQRCSIDDKMTKFVNNIEKLSVTNRGLDTTLVRGHGHHEK